MFTLRYGAYRKTSMWKWGARATGSGTIWLLILGLPEGLLVFLVTMAIGAVLSAHAGLSRDPDLYDGSFYPGGGLIGWTLRLQDTIGDIMLTTIWNVVRRLRPNTDDALAG